MNSNLITTFVSDFSGSWADGGQCASAACGRLTRGCNGCFRSDGRAFCSAHRRLRRLARQPWGSLLWVTDNPSTKCLFRCCLLPSDAAYCLQTLPVLAVACSAGCHERIDLSVARRAFDQFEQLMGKRSCLLAWELLVAC